MSLLSLTLPLPDGEIRAQAAGGGQADAAMTSTVIAELRRQLAAPGMLAHPAVCRELRKLEEQLHSQLAADGRAPGRHRAGPGPLRRLPAEGEPDEPDRAVPGRAGAGPRPAGSRPGSSLGS